MRLTVPVWFSALLWRGAGASLVLGLALTCGNFVEDSARARRASHMALMIPKAITPLSATLVSAVDVAFVPPQSRLLPFVTCTPVLSLTAKEGAMIVVTLEAPCAADTPVSFSHGGMTFAARMPIGRPLHLSIPALESHGSIVASLQNGARVMAAVEVPDLADYHRFAVTRTGAQGFDLTGLEGLGQISADDPGQGPGSTSGWLVSLGDADLTEPQLAQVYTYPTLGVAETQVNVRSSATLCGQHLTGQTISSRMGMADATALRVDLPECGAGPVVMHLKNLDQDVKVASR